MKLFDRVYNLRYSFLFLTVRPFINILFYFRTVSILLIVCVLRFSPCFFLTYNLRIFTVWSRQIH